MITVTCEPYVLCSKCEDTSWCAGTYTCEVVSIGCAFGRWPIEQAIKYGKWQILGDEIYCPHCAAVVARNALEMAREAK